MNPRPTLVPPAPPPRARPEPAAERHIVLRNGTESILGAIVVGSYDSAIEAAASAEDMHRKFPGFFFWHTPVYYRVIETTNISSRRLGPGPST